MRVVLPLALLALAAGPAQAKQLQHANPWRAGDRYELALSLQAIRQAASRTETLCSHQATVVLTATKAGNGVVVATRATKWWAGTGIGDCEPLQLLHAVENSWSVDETGDVSRVRLGPLPSAARAALSDWSRAEQRDTMQNFWGGTFGLIHAAAVTPVESAKDWLDVPPLSDLVDLKLSHDLHPCAEGGAGCARGVLSGHFEGTLDGQPVEWRTTEELLLDGQGRPALFRRRKVEPLVGITTTLEIRFRALTAAKSARPPAAPDQRPPRSGTPGARR